MALETGNYINSLVATNPTAADPKSDGDDHLRLIKATVKNTLPNLTGPMTATQTELNYMVGATTQPAMKDGSNLTTPAPGDSSTKIATTQFVASTAFASQLPAQTGNAGKFLGTDGSVASWTTILPPQILRSARTANTMLGTADRTSFIDITSGTFTQTFDAAATLGNGWYCYIRNSGMGDITLDPNASETIDGLASFIMYPGEARLIQCDGTDLRSVVLQSFSKVYTASGSFVKPPGYTVFAGEMWGAGASGGFYSNTAVSAFGGGGGAYVPFNLLSSSLAASESVTIGAGGAAQTADNNSYGIAGGNTSFKGFVAYGGGTSASLNQGGSAFLSNITFSYNHAFGHGVEAANSYALWGGGAASITAGRGSTIWGGGGGLSFDASNVQVASGGTKFGGAGGATSAAAGVAPGGGGAATRSVQSGAGARGELRIWGVA